MEIAKSKLIETFNKECERISTTTHIEFLRNSGSIEEPVIEVIANSNVSFMAIKLSNNENSYTYYGKILFGGFIDYKSVELTEEEFNSLFENFEKAEFSVRNNIKNQIISNGEKALQEIL